MVECPTISYLDSLVKNKRLRELQTSNEGGEPVVVVAHLTPSDIVADPRYQDWMKGWVEQAM